MLTSAVAVSLSASLTAAILCAIVGIPAAYALAVHEFPGKKLLLDILQTLLALPTVVVGLFVYSIICRGAVLGSMGLLFTPAAIVIGQVVLALPIMVTHSHASFAAVNRSARETAQTLGAGSYRIGTTLVSEARFGILAAVAATFGRLIGEVGVSMMLGGNIAKYTRTMTTTIALETSKGEFSIGLRLGLILMAIALTVNFCLRYLNSQMKRMPA